jgi:hypothetical protein
MAIRNDKPFMDDKSVALPDDSGENTFSGGSLVNFVKERYSRSKQSRRYDEERWLRAYRNYRGIYGADMKFTDAEKSRVFIKVTKTKVLAAYGQIVDVLFSGNKFPLSVDATPQPIGIAEHVHIDMAEEQKKAAGQPAAPSIDISKPLPPGTKIGDLLGSMKNAFKGLNVKEGVGKSPTQLTFSPAQVAARKMDKKIRDQLDESGAATHLRSTAFECALFGTGIMKGPFAVDKEYPRWEGGKYKPIMKTMPKSSHVSVWNSYIDPDASNIAESSYFIERHKLSKTQMLELKRRPMFRSSVIDALVIDGPNYIKEYWEDDLSDYQPNMGVERWEVLEYWGAVDVELLRDNDIDIPEEFGDSVELQANIWFSGGKVIRLVLNPFKPARIPYYVVPYELNPYSMYGVGVSENMDDTQTLMNGFMRLAVDNAVLSGNLVFEVDETNLVPGQDLTVYPGKVFRRQGGAPGQALFGTSFPNVAQTNLQLFDKARVLADESTGMPSFAHGQTGVSGVGRTSSGISMLMNAASINIKTVIKNMDDYLLRPIGEAFFSFNMQFDPDPEIVGDLEVNARGTESLMANEVRSQRLLQFLQVVQNPVLAPFAKLPYIVREIAKSMDLDPELVSNDMEEAAKQALLLQKMQPPASPAAPGGAPPAPGEQPMPVSDTSGGGGGNIGVGTAPTPGEQGFSAAPQQPPMQ